MNVIKIIYTRITTGVFDLMHWHRTDQANSEISKNKISITHAQFAYSIAISRIRYKIRYVTFSIDTLKAFKTTHFS